jgi:hypothetical protein
MDDLSHGPSVPACSTTRPDLITTIDVIGVDCRGSHHLIRRSIRRVRDSPQRSLSGVESCAMILVDGLIVGRVAVSVAVDSLIM